MLLQWQPEPFIRNGSGRFGAVKSDSTHNYFGNACQGHCSFPVVDWLCLFVDLWVVPFPLEDWSVFGNFVITLTSYSYSIRSTTYDIEHTFLWKGIELTALLVINTDCISRCNSGYYATAVSKEMTTLISCSVAISLS
jgi:hypothetical protein